MLQEPPTPFGEPSGEQSAGLLAATLFRLVLRGGFFKRKQSRHVLYAYTLYVPFPCSAESSNSFLHLHLNFLGCTLVGGLADW